MAVSSETIDELAEKGMKENEISQYCGAGRDCGTCRAKIKKYIDSKEQATYSKD